MIEQDGFKNYCVLKTFGVRRSEVQPFLSSGSVSVDFSEDCLDGTILIVNGEGDEVEFQAQRRFFGQDLCRRRRLARQKAR